MGTGTKKVVYIDGGAFDVSVEREVVEERGYEFVVAGCATDDEVVDVAGDAAAILVALYPLTSDLFQRLPSLEVVVRGGVGFDNIDVDAATAAGTAVCNIVDYGTDEVANHAFAMLLALNRKLIRLDHAIRTGSSGPAPRLMPHTGRVAGQTLGLVSFGAIARAVAQRAAGFGMRVLAYDPYLVSPDVAGVEFMALHDVLAQSDYVSVHTPLSAETRGLIDAAELALMKPSSYLIVTSRGGVVDEAALAEALLSERIAGAGIDVWEHEPPDPEHPLLKLDNVVVSMHAAWYSQVADLARQHAHAQTAVDVLDGNRVRTILNPSARGRTDLVPRP
jgi:D-3-phosphoglycerate dehydrogenase